MTTTLLVKIIQTTGAPLYALDAGRSVALDGWNVMTNTTLGGCTFTQVRQGGHIVGGALHTATGNIFQQIPANLPNDVSYGLRFEGATNLTVSETNTFSSTNVGTYGVIVKDCAANASEFARNTFTNVDFGVQTEQNNSGLQIRCNGYTGHDKAWSINPASPPNTSGLFPNQGICGVNALQAGNLFNDPDCPSPGVPESHIKSKLNFAYRTRSGAGYNANEIPTCVSNGPTGTNGIVSLDFCGSTSNINACAPPCTNCFAAQSMMSAAANESDPWSQQNLYNQAINLYWQEDNTQAALDAIKNHFPNDPNLAVGLLVNAGNYEAAQAKVATLGLDEPSKGWAALYQVAIDLGKNGKSILQLDALQEAKLFQVAQGVSPAKYAAQNILTFAKGYVFARPVEVWKEEGLQGEPDDRSTEKVLSNTSAPNWLGLSPNPTTGIVEVRWIPTEGQGTLEVFHVSGRLVVQEKVALANGLQVLTLNAHPRGLYLVHLRSAFGSVTRKLIIE